jgi:hypothetical protein
VLLFFYLSEWSSIEQRWGLFLKRKLLMLALCGWYAYVHSVRVILAVEL